MEFMKFAKQYKGKDYDKVPKSKKIDTSWFVGRKYDGQYVQIHKDGDEVRLFSSSGLMFRVKEIEDELRDVPFDFIVEAEYNNNSDGTMLNDRRFSSVTTAICKYKKSGEALCRPYCIVHIFDILAIRGPRSLVDLRDYIFLDRRIYLDKIGSYLKRYKAKHVEVVDFVGPKTIHEAKNIASGYIIEGGEGAFAFHRTHTIKEQGRSNLAIKLKAVHTDEFTCVGVAPSMTVKGENGALVLETPYGLHHFGGLTDKLRKASRDDVYGCWYLRLSTSK